MTLLVEALHTVVAGTDFVPPTGERTFEQWSLEGGPSGIELEVGRSDDGWTSPSQLKRVSDDEASEAAGHEAGDSIAKRASGAGARIGDI